MQVPKGEVISADDVPNVARDELTPAERLLPIITALVISWIIVR
jgi:hypothetical protein